MHTKAIEILESMRNGSFGDGVRPGLSSFTASILSAMSNHDWNEVLRINDLMIQSGITPTSTTFQGVLLAHIKLGNIKESVEAMEVAVKTKVPIDKVTFQFCAKSLLPDHHGNGDINLMRNNMKNLSSESPSVATEAMNLNKRLRDCLQGEQQRPSKRKNLVVIKKEVADLWRCALDNAIQLSKLM